MEIAHIRSRAAWRVPALLCAVLPGAAGCGDATGESTWSTRAYVYGTVTRAGGGAATGYGVSAVATAALSCAEGDFGAAPAGGSIVVPTDSRGRYRALVISPNAPFTGCLRVDVVEHGTAGPVLASGRGARVSFTTQNAAGVHDSVRVDLRVP